MQVRNRTLGQKIKSFPSERNPLTKLCQSFKIEAKKINEFIKNVNFYQKPSPANLN